MLARFVTRAPVPSCPVAHLRKRRRGAASCVVVVAAHADRRPAGRGGRRAALRRGLGARRLRGDARRADAPPTSARCRCGEFTAAYRARGRRRRPRPRFAHGEVGEAARRRRQRPDDRHARASSGRCARRCGCRSPARTTTGASTGRRACRSPACAAGERLERRTQLPRARGPPRARRHAARAGPGPHVADRRRRGLDRRRARPAAARARRARCASSAIPTTRAVGVSGLERVFDERFAGRPGGELRAGARVLARDAAAAGDGRSARRSIPSVQRAAVAAHGARARRRRRRAPAHRRDPRARRDRLLRPAAAGLDVQDRHARRRARGASSPGRTRRYPVETKTTIEGVELENANGESCGGTLRDVVRALVQLGLRAARRAARRRSGSSKTAEQFGFNSRPRHPGRGDEHDPAARARSATTSRSARRRSARAACRRPRCRWRWVAATIAGRGRRPRLTLERGPRAAAHAGRARRASRALVGAHDGGRRRATGTGTRGGDRRRARRRQDRHRRAARHERSPTARPAPIRRPRRARRPEPDDPTDTDAWFAAYAPAGDAARRGRRAARRGRRRRRDGRAGRAGRSLLRGAQGDAVAPARRRSDVEVDDAGLLGASRPSIFSSSGRLSSASSVSLKSSSEPCVGRVEAGRVGQRARARRAGIGSVGAVGEQVGRPRARPA